MTTAEEAVVGCAILDEECARKAVDALSEEMFFKEDMRTIFGCIAQRYWKGLPIDTVTVVDELPELKIAIVTAAQSVPLLRNIDAYITIVKDSWQDKVLRKAMSVIATGDKTVAEKLEELDALTQKHRSLLSSNLNAVDFQEAALEFRAWLTAKSEDRVSTGFRCMDASMGGLLKSTVFTLSARSGGGKTDLAINLALKMAKAKKRVLYFSMEMPRVQLMQRVSSNILGINGIRIRDKSLSEDEICSMDQVSSWLGNGKLLFVDEPGISIETVRSYVEAYKPEAVFIDHIGLMQRPNAKDQYKALGMVSNGLKRLALEKKLAIVQLVQMNRQIEGRASRKPNLSDLRESGDIEQDSDYVGFLVPEEIGDKQISGNAWLDVKMHLEKNRHGNAGILNFHWQPQYHRYTELETRY